MYVVTERTSARYTAHLQDENGNAVPGSDLTSLKLTLYELETGQIINGRDAQDVLNANGVTLDDQGDLVWQLDPADNAIVVDGRASETHRAVFDAEWGSSKRLVHHFDIQVGNEAVVTT